MIENLLSKLRKVKPTGSNRWIACCPAHDDKTPSLAIKNDDGKILLKCFAGCGAHDIVDSIGLSIRDLYQNKDYDYYQPAVKNPIPLSDVLECIQQAAMVVLINAGKMQRGENIDHESLVNAIKVIQNAYDR